MHKAILPFFFLILYKPIAAFIGTSLIDERSSFCRHSSTLFSQNSEDEERMRLIRQVQDTFYGSGETNWLERDSDDLKILRNLPLWRVQWTELIGFQNVLNVHVPHYTHMFRTLVRQHERPWYFGSIWLPGGSENLGNPDYFLPENANETNDQVSTIGTLMQITDYTEQDDGRLTLIVQGVARIKVISASQQVPYAIADQVEIVPDAEAVQQFGMVDAVQDAACCTAVQEGFLLNDLEYHLMDMESLTMNQVSPLSNVNGSVVVDFDQVQDQLRETFAKRSQMNAVDDGSDETLLATLSLKLERLDQFTEDAEAVERQVWIELDRMLRLLEAASPNTRIPVPSQLLGLLPVDVDWPSGFRLENYANQLEDANIGTFSKSAFVRLAQRYPRYPSLRRISRLSYTIWLLLDSIALSGEPNRPQSLLETTSVIQRLKRARNDLRAMNAVVTQ